MKRIIISIGCWVAGLLLVLLLYALAWIFASPWVIFIAVVLAALDAKRIRVWRYESDIAQKPSVLFLLMLLFGWLVLPWYVGLRLNILAGTARLKPGCQWLEEGPPITSKSPITASLMQPWSARWRRKFSRRGGYKGRGKI